MSNAIMKSYDLVGVKEDVSNEITNITPTAVPFQSAIGSYPVHQTLFEWQEDSLQAPAANAQIEGADAPTAVQNPTVMRSNTTQIFSKTAKVSGTTEVTKTYGRDRELAYQLMLRSKELKKDFERALIGVTTTSVAGSDSTARQFANYFPLCDGSAVYTVNSTTGALNTALTSQTAAPLREDIITDVMLACYNNGSDPNTLMVKPSDKLIVAGFQAVGRTRFSENGQKSIVNTVDVYESPFGELKVVMNRNIQTSTALVFEPVMWKKAVLRNWFRQTLAKTGDSTNVQILGEFGMVHKNYAASGGVINLT